MSTTEDLPVLIDNPDERIWEGRAYSISSENSAGPFDILPHHANFVTIIQQKPIRVMTSEGEKTFTYKNAVIAVYDNAVSIYSDI